MELTEKQHQDFIWTWPSTHRKGKASLWLPYFQGVTKLGRGKPFQYKFSYNGGEFQADLRKIDFIMFYGASGDISLEFLDDLSKLDILFTIHRRQMTAPFIFHSSKTSNSGKHDVLTKQILARENEIRSSYVAKTLVRERIKSMKDYIEISEAKYKRLKSLRSVDLIRSTEAEASNAFWRTYYSRMDLYELSRRDREHPVNQALNAGSMFLAGIMLRWILFHKLSPSHGFLHVRTSFDSLVYDLIEPYRYLIEESVQKAYQEVGLEDNKLLTAKSLNNLKIGLKRPIYCPQTKQEVREKALLHGIVLSLRSYLIGDSKRFVIPTKGVRKVADR